MSRLPRTPHSRAVHGAALAFALFLGLSGTGPAFGAFAVDTDDIEVGDCFNTGADIKGAAPAPLSVDVVPCEEPHQSEAFAVFDLPDGPHPGEEKVIATADEKCGGEELSDYVGADAKLPDTIRGYYYYPHSVNWTEGDRSITCFLADSAGPSTGSLRTSAP
ncbi:septum formation family protein [Streptomyces antimicrobicus]|uniref:Septum formation family protein n=1 Tax=Streptomyces antimicrobicus TaxID=2883108 RepID=A0ABS8B024_9ACTN|nr:septum formation family protein [Streptomyces antimicrobicus]MCB5177959.1 septum formation family protein [Streptomyces antimicrobicus]